MPFECTKCGAEHVVYSPQCTACGAWSTVRSPITTEERPPPQKYLGPYANGQPTFVPAVLPEPVPSTSTDIPQVPRVLTGWAALDALLGGDLTPGFAATATYLLAGEPGAGKSALSVEVAGRVALRYPGLAVLYAIVERALEEVASDVRRLEAERPNLLLVHALDAETIASLARARRLSLLVVDSLQPLAAHSADIPRVARVFRELAAELRVPTILVSRLNARGLALGPNDTRHDVGAELGLSWEEGSAERMLAIRKNRYGPSSSTESPPLYLRMNARGRLVETANAALETEETPREIPLSFS